MLPLAAQLRFKSIKIKVTEGWRPGIHIKVIGGIYMHGYDEEARKHSYLTNLQVYIYVQGIGIYVRMSQNPFLSHV